MNYIYYLEILIQILLCVHALKTGRSTTWIFILLIFPVVGSLIYIIVELIPSLRFSPSNFVMDTTEDVVRKINPTRKLEKLKEEIQFSNTLKNKEALADEYLLCGYIDEAIEMYKECLKGVYQDDTKNTFSLAKAYYLKQDYQKSRETLERLVTINKDYREGDVNLLLAQSLEKLNEIELAEKKYTLAINHFIGEEARFRFALFLKNQNRITEANELFNKLIKNVERSPRYVQKEQGRWVKQSKILISKN